MDGPFCPTLDAEIRAMIARIVGFREMKLNPKARTSIDVDMGKLRMRNVWDESRVQAKRLVAKEARDNGEDVHFARIFPKCTEKNFELEIENDSGSSKGECAWTEGRKW